MSTRCCPACGFEAPQADGPVHAYLTVSPECWAQFNVSMALHYSDMAYWRAHQLLVDAYTVQHSPGADRRAVQSAALHLTALVHAMENPDAPEARTIRLRKGLSGRDDLFPKFDPYPTANVTIARVATEDGPDAHWDTVRAYARAVYEDWQAHHGLARDLIAEALR